MLLHFRPSRVPGKWYRWFAWYPVSVSRDNSQYAWLETIEFMYISGLYDAFYARRCGQDQPLTKPTVTQPKGR